MEKLRRYRQVHGLSQKQLAKCLGVDPGTIASWESGRHRPMRGKVVAVQELLDGGSILDGRGGGPFLHAR